MQVCLAIVYAQIHRVLDQLEMELQMLVSCHAGAESSILVLCKGNKCS